MRSFEMKKYKIFTDALGSSIAYEENNRLISFPEAPGNRHYEEYLAWVAEGNTAEVIEEP